MTGGRLENVYSTSFLIERARAAQCSALMLTLELQILGQRHKDIKNGLAVLRLERPRELASRCRALHPMPAKIGLNWTGRGAGASSRAEVRQRRVAWSQSITKQARP